MDVVNIGFGKEGVLGKKEFWFGLERWQGKREGNQVLY